ncbi:MAG TPA: CARDB domain-containing protein [Nocardioides sp.]|nr:CARDB domain-containing protein [Nocardioides sp.]
MARWVRWWVCAAVATALAVPAAPEASAAGGRAPDLTVVSVAAPSTVAAGSTAKVRVKVRNGGTSRAASSVTAFRLSADKRVGDDRLLKPAAATPALSPGRSWSGRVGLSVPPATAAGGYYVLACADAKRRVREKSEGNNCRPSARVTVTAAATSHDLIDADVAAGVLTEEQGLVYKVYSDFRDPRLPDRYAAATDGLEEGALTEAAQSWDSLSPAAQDELRPFLVPAFYPGSHWTPAPPGRPVAPRRGVSLDAPWCSGSADVQPAYETWDHLDSAGGNFRVWWLHRNPGDSALAARLAGVLDSTILPELVKLMGHSYKPDGGGFCDGGTGAVDIALVDAATAMTYPDGPCGAGGTSTHLVWPRTKPAPWADIEPYLAHEVMHMIQFGMPVAGSCGDSSWLREMTAEWVQDYVTDPAYGIGLAPDDTEHLAAPLYLDRPKVSLDADTPPKHDYGSYLLPFFAARKTGPDIVRDMWVNAATMNPTAAVDAALPGGFEAVWPEFALDNWNRGPVHDYQDWDQLGLGAKAIGPEPMPVGTRTPTVHVEHLAAQYLTLDIDPGVTELEVTNDLAGDADASLQAVIEYDDGSTKVVPMSTQQKTTICIDDGNRRATSVVLVFADSGLTAPVDFAPTLVGKASCGCQASSPKTAARAGATCTGNVTFSWHEEITDVKPEGVAGRTTVTGEGTLAIGFLPPDPDDPGAWYSDPASTYSVSRTWHSESYRSCGTETGDTSETGSGTFGQTPTFAYHDPDSDAVLLSTIFLMDTTKTEHFVSCVGTTDDTVAGHLTPPQCPPDPTKGNVAWTFEPVSAGSDTYRIDCSGTATWEDGLGQHVLTGTVSGTITLP